MKGSWRRRCDAWSKHTAARKAGKLRGISWRCRKWAVPGKTRCYLHGGRSTGPRTPGAKPHRWPPGSRGAAAASPPSPSKGRKSTPATTAAARTRMVNP
jgi:hypothetical protein